jgi:hypothetical protein
MLNSFFAKTHRYLSTLDLEKADPLDKKVSELINNENTYEKASQALRRRFVRGSQIVDGVDRGGRKTRIRREEKGGKYRYLLEGLDGSWNEPEERIWIVAMYALWQGSKKK